jgi:hypothetical protein
MSKIPKIRIPKFAWSFNEDGVLSQAEFSIKAKEYQIDIFKKDTWKPDVIVYPFSQIKIFVAGMPLSIFYLQTSNPSGFTTLELMSKIHNRMQKIDLGDHVYFESLIYIGDSDDNIGIYEIELGN